mgnify:CR=1 FL=1
MSERIINAERIEQIINVFGSFDENIKRIEQTYGVKITNRGTELKISGEDEAADRAGRAIEGLLLLAAKGETIDEQKVRYLIDLVSSGNEDKIGEMAKDVVCITAKGRPVKAKTLGQQRYMKAILKNTITIGVGPAGTGKTYLAVAAAVAAFREKAVNRIILTRPAVEAGERLGFLPGDLQNKVDPYLRPLYDALYDMLGAETYQKYLERGNIEVAPLYARPHARRQLHHPRRGAEHDARADENVPDATGLRLEDRHHRRHYADRSALRQGQWSEGRRAHSGQRAGYRHLPPDGKRRRAPRPGAAHHRGL